MHRALVVLTDGDTDERLLDAANRYATGTDTELVVCKFIDRDQYQREVRNDAREGNQAPTIEMIEAEAKSEAEEIADRAFGGDMTVRTLGAAGSLPKKILEVAAEEDCDHVFVSGRKRSPTGKALFGDIAQSVLLRFDGPVTITTKSE
ncbi:universal stress protein [Natrinema amylolyticum]|uniref:universal stress protein n=1 Tax=Natrinema amylolyticum TaxID=2878679 RepID=UPI001CF9C58B|nr:universal stress protein [Natrinema amylolyticum]